MPNAKPRQKARSTKRNPISEWDATQMSAVLRDQWGNIPRAAKLADQLLEADTDAKRDKVATQVEKFLVSMSADPEELAAILGITEEPSGEPSVEDINRALIAGTLGVGESGRVRPLPGVAPRRAETPHAIEIRERQARRRGRAALRGEPHEDPRVTYAIQQYTALQTGARDWPSYTPQFAFILGYRDVLSRLPEIYQIAADRLPPTLLGERTMVGFLPANITEVMEHEYRAGMEQAHTDLGAAVPAVAGYWPMADRARYVEPPFPAPARVRHVQHPQGAVEARMQQLAEEADSLLREWNHGYDLDGGGYSFEIAPHAITAELEHAGTHWTGRMLQWEAPDLDYILGGDMIPQQRTADLLLIVPGGLPVGWPEEFVVGTDLYTKLNSGDLLETEHDCIWCGAGTGNEAEQPRCMRCEATGYVNSPGGQWAVYERSEAPDVQRETQEDRRFQEASDAAATRDIIRGMANAIWWSSWAEAMEEAGRSRELPGRNIAEIAPETPRRALAFGEALYDAINDTTRAHRRQNAADFVLDEWKRIERDEPHRASLEPENFGYYLAMESLGHGVAWTDDHEAHRLTLPDIEAALYDPDDGAHLDVTGLEGRGVR